MKKSYCSYIRLQLLNYAMNLIFLRCKISLISMWKSPYLDSFGCGFSPSPTPFFLVCILWLREEAPCWVSVEQSPFVLGLASENGELLLDECVQVTEGSKTRERHLFLFSDVIVFAKLK